MGSEEESRIEELIERLLEVDDEEEFGVDASYEKGYEKRKEAIKPFMEELVKCGETAAPYLVDVLNEYDTWSCIFAAEILGAITIRIRTEAEASIEALIDALEAFADALNEAAENALVKIGKPAIPYLIKRIENRINNPSYTEDGEKIDTIFTIGTLARIKDDSAFDFLIRLLEERNPEVDLDFLCCCIADQKNPDAIPYLERIAEEYRTKSWRAGIGMISVATEALDSIRELKAVKMAMEEALTIYGCCQVCKHYDEHEGYCTRKGAKKGRTKLCFDCEPGCRLLCEFKCSSNGKECEHFENQFFYVAPEDFDIVHPWDLIENRQGQGLNVSFHYDTRFYISLHNTGFQVKVPCNNIEKLTEFTNLLKRGVDFRWVIDLKMVEDEEILTDFSFSEDGNNGLCITCTDLKLILRGGTLKKLIAMLDFNRFAFLTGVYHDYYGRERIERDIRETGCEHEFEELNRLSNNSLSTLTLKVNYCVYT
jgi:hypothetical protein